MAVKDQHASLASASSQSLSITDASQTGLDLQTDFTLELWVQFPSIAASQPLIYKWQSSGDERAYALQWNQTAGELRLSTTTDGTSGTSVTQGVAWTPTINTWYHVAISYDVSAGDAKFYVDGSQQGTTQGSGNTSIHNASAAFILGRDGDSGSTYMGGFIDDVRVWNDIRTGAEINDNKGSELVGNEAGLVSYWKFNDGASSTSADTHANGNHLTNNNNVTIGVFHTNSSEMALTASFPAPTVFTENYVFALVTSLTASMPAPTATVNTRKWSNEDKTTAATFTNESKT